MGSEDAGAPWACTKADRGGKVNGETGRRLSGKSVSLSSGGDGMPKKLEGSLSLLWDPSWEGALEPLMLSGVLRRLQKLRDGSQGSDWKSVGED